MRTFTRRLQSVSDVRAVADEVVPRDPQVIFAFWNSKLDAAPLLAEVAARFPGATLVGCSTAGSISSVAVTDSELVITGIAFNNATVHATVETVHDISESNEVGSRLAESLAATEPLSPRFVFVLSDGLLINGSALVAGMREHLPGVPISGGLAGDDAQFATTATCLGGDVGEHQVVAVGFWGTDLTVGHGSAGGWEAFGPSRIITKADGATLWELDGQPALDLYRTYLGDEADELPASALRFPLEISDPAGRQSLVRTVLALDPDTKAMRFAGDMPVGWNARLMRTSFDRLVEGAQTAAERSLIPRQRVSSEPVVALAVSCVGRRLVLGQRTDEELEACAEIIGADAVLTGFYSYGEIAPVEGFVGLHNQTMTLTTITEAAAGG